VSATPQERLPESIPSGTVTFVFTDIEGSTERWDRNRAAMQSAVRRHDELVRLAIAERHGHVFKTIGDAFCAAFSRPEDAVAATLAAQLALANEDFTDVSGLNVRAAIHVGTADERGGDYFGPAVNRVARLLAIAYGGQVLLSGATADLVQGELPPQASLRDLGEHQLKDLARPEYVYQLLAPGLRPEFPALRSLDILPNNLPRQMTSFVGREKEVAEITALVATNPLVTLVGSGGVGKTRTSLQVGANVIDGSGDGVWFVELAPLTSGEYIPTTIAAALGITLGEGDPLALLVAAMKSKRALLIFDNCEHLVDASARTISAILRGCPQIKILASTRQALGIAGEETYRMPSLGLPLADEAAPLTALDASAASAIALFVERGVSVDKRFVLTDDNAPIVADICRRLDGIPLAIELAASRVQILSPRQLRDRLDERFRVLTGGSRDVLPRQQTLRALIDWSHDLLDERERRLFRRLGIFVNGFTIEGASAVASSDDLDELDVFDLLASLASKSLVIAEPEGDSLRYRLLESTRAYALEKLSHAGERDLLAARHLRYLVARFSASRAKKRDSKSRRELKSLFAAELEDSRVALDGALSRSDIIDGSELLAAIGGIWENIGLEAEGIARNQAYLAALSPTETRLLAMLSLNLALFWNNSAKMTLAFEMATDAVEHARACGEPLVLARALILRSRSAINLGRLDDTDADLAEVEAMPQLDEGQQLSMLACRAYLAAARGDLDAACKTYEDLRKHYRSTGDATAESTSAIGLAENEHRRGHTQRAIAITHEYLPAARSGADRSLLWTLTTNLAGYYASVDDTTSSTAAARESIASLAARDVEHPFVAGSIEHLALASALQGDLSRAAMLEGFANTALERNGVKRGFTETTTYHRLNALLSDGLPPEELTRLTTEGAVLTPEAAVALALEDS
jgi:predicted ATPase/class 3 adenylate cyclase